ncbi:MAG TPA: murein biosynthesis integral membrane protein MurJ [Acidimicrobiales bacterium]|nr:murein biosynthesis integral membrane protein MurJ [Acidimicrobiales bacterium]
MTAEAEGPDSKSALARASWVMAAGTALSRLTGFGRIAALAAAFGFTRLTDAYNLANTTPNILYELVLGGVLGGTLVTVFTRHLRNDEDGGRAAVSAVVGVAAVTLIAISLLLAVAAPLVIGLYSTGAGFPSDQREVATSLLRWFAPQVAILGIITLAGALLNARRRFAAPMWAPIAANVAIIGVVLGAGSAFGTGLDAAEAAQRPGLVILLGAGTTAAYALQAGILFVCLRRTNVWGGWQWQPGHPAVRTVLRLSGWLVGLTAANQIALWVMLTLAGRRAGGISSFRAAELFFQLPHAVITVSVASAVLPGLAELWAEDRRAEFARRTRWALRSTAALVIPAALALFLLARPVVAIALERGALSSSSVDLTTDVLRMLALGIPGFSGFLLLVRCCFAMADTRAAFWLYVLQNSVAVIVAVTTFDRLGVRALGLAYAVSYSLAALAAVVYVGRRTGASLLYPSGANPDH